jgi:hypothetical protein
MVEHHEQRSEPHMHPTLLQPIARERLAELVREADANRLAAIGKTPKTRLDGLRDRLRRAASRFPRRPRRPVAGVRLIGGNQQLHAPLGRWERT